MSSSVDELRHLKLNLYILCVCVCVCVCFQIGNRVDNLTIKLDILSLVVKVTTLQTVYYKHKLYFSIMNHLLNKICVTGLTF